MIKGCHFNLRQQLLLLGAFVGNLGNKYATLQTQYDTGLNVALVKWGPNIGTEDPSIMNAQMQEAIEDLHNIINQQKSIAATSNRCGGLGTTMAKLMGYTMTLEVLPIDIDQPEGSDALCTVCS